MASHTFYSFPNWFFTIHSDKLWQLEFWKTRPVFSEILSWKTGKQLKNPTCFAHNFEWATSSKQPQHKELGKGINKELHSCLALFLRKLKGKFGFLAKGFGSQTPFAPFYLDWAINQLILFGQRVWFSLWLFLYIIYCSTTPVVRGYPFHFDLEV